MTIGKWTRGSIQSGVCLLAFVSGSMPAWAQEAPATDASATEASGSRLGDIIVTARKRDERLQDVPVAITAFTGADLQRSGTQSFTQMATKVPQLQIAAATTPAGSVISLRGIGSSGLTASVDQAVSLNLDGIQLSQANGLQLGIYDVQRIEVLKGPQALFFGKNSPGGVISLVSAEPGKEFEARFRSGFEFAHKQKFGELMVSTPLTDTLRARVVGYVSSQKGWFRNLASAIPEAEALTGISAIGASTRTSPKQDEYFVRGTLVYEAPGGSFDATLKAAYGRQDRDNGGTASNQIFDCPTGVPQDYAGLFDQLPGAAGDCKLDRNYVDPDIPPEVVATAPSIYRDGKPFYLNRQTLISLTANYDLSDDLKLTSVTGYYKLRDHWSGSFLGTELATLANANGNGIRQWTEELRVVSSFDSPLNFVAGGFYQDFKFSTFSAVSFAPPLFTPALTDPFLAVDDHFRQRTKAYSLFGQLIYNFAPGWEATAGARYSYEKKRAIGERRPSAFSGGFLLPLEFDKPRVSFNDVSPEATLSYKPNSDLTLYAAYREGFVSGGYNLVAFQFPDGTGKIRNATYDPATVRGGEIGAKGSMADGQIRFDLAVYQYKYKDLQLSAALPAPAIGLVLRNAAKATIKGVELSVHAAPRAVPGLQLRSTIAYNHGRYDSFPDAPCYGGQTQALGCNRGQISAGPPPVFQAQDLSGAQLLRSPDWGINLGFTYELPMGGDIILSATGDTSYASSYQSELESDPRSRQRSVWKHDASIAMRGPDDAWEFALIGKNLTNKLRIINGFSLSGTGTSPGTVGPSVLADKHGSVSEPRTVLLQLTLRDSLLRR